MTAVETFNLVASIFSIVTGAVALALALVFFFSAKKAERNSELAMVKIEEATAAISTISMKMLNRLTSAIIAPKPTDEKLTDILKAVKEGGQLTADLDETTKTDKATIEQFRVDNLIAAYYYCTLTNLAYQSMLPPTISETIGYEIITRVVEQTKSDCEILKNWIANSKDINTKISLSPVKHLYEETAALESSVQSVAEHYANQEA